MISQKLFCYALMAFGASMGCVSAYIFIRMKPSYVAVAEKIPRNFILGAVFGVAAVGWCIPQAIAIFSAGMTTTIYVLAAVSLVIGIFFLDYLFARAFAGFIILLSHFFLAESFAADLHLLWLFSTLCIIMGVFGIVIGGMPYLLRDILRKICSKPSWKVGAVIVTAIYAATGLITGIAVFI